MGSTPNIITGAQYNYWTLIERCPVPEGYNSLYIYCLCRCVCGKTKPVLFASLKAGTSKSCGCMKGYPASRTHGRSREPVYKVWSSMRDRCSNPNNPRYRDYGGRGISVCDRWESFELFIEDMGERPEGMQIDRIDNNVGYYKENCRWVSPKENMRNKNNLHKITLNGETKIIREWSERTGINHETIRCRIARGWSVEKALNTPGRASA